MAPQLRYLGLDFVEVLPGVITGTVDLPLLHTLRIEPALPVFFQNGSWRLPSLEHVDISAGIHNHLLHMLPSHVKALNLSRLVSLETLILPLQTILGIFPELQVLCFQIPNSDSWAGDQKSFPSLREVAMSIDLSIDGPIGKAVRASFDALSNRAIYPSITTIRFLNPDDAELFFTIEWWPAVRDKLDLLQIRVEDPMGILL
jgi:hypothetical protein